MFVGVGILLRIFEVKALKNLLFKSELGVGSHLLAVYSYI